jgi:ABC-type multidrug transport system fused ATPase/permease subunit
MPDALSTAPLLGEAKPATADRLPPIESHSWFSQFLFLYMHPVFSQAIKHKRLTFADIHAAGVADDPVLAFRRYLGSYKHLAVLPRLAPLLHGYWGRWLYAALLLLISNVGGLALPIMIQYTLSYLDSPEAFANKWKGFAFAGGIFGAAVLQAVTIHKFWWEASRVGLHSQFNLTSALFVKALQLSPAAKLSLRLTKGKLLNHLSSDACKLNDQFLFATLHWQTWSATITVAVALFYLVQLLGVAGAAGAAAMVIFVPLISLLTRLTRNLTVKVQKRRDARGKLVSEMVSGITTLKVYSWVDWFTQHVFDAREKEKVAIRKRQLLGVCTDAISSACPVLILACTFGLYAYLNPNKPLTAAQAFSAVSWVASLQFPLRSVPYCIATVVDCTASLDRLRKITRASDADVSMMAQWTEKVEKEQGEQPGTHEDDGPTQKIVPMKHWLQLEELQSVNEQPPLPPLDGDGSNTSGAVGSINVLNACFAWPTLADDDDDEETAKKDGNNNKKDEDKTPKAPLVAATCVDCATSVARFDALALEEELQRQKEEKKGKSKKQKKDEADKPVIALQWRPILHSISFTCAPGTLTLIAAKVGAGKSSLLQGLIGEAFLLSGTANVTGRIAYCSQSPWILSRSIKQNITFASPYDREWYRTVVKACCLDGDIAGFAKKDKELVGDQGITLSGGQKARLALARAVYSDADVYLLDEILGAVDAIIASRIWEECIKGLLLKRGKTVLLASHAVHFARRPEVSQVIVLDTNGKMLVPAGSYAQVVAAAAASGETDRGTLVRNILAVDSSSLEEEMDGAAVSTPNPVDGGRDSSLAVAASAAAASSSASPSAFSSTVVSSGAPNVEEGAVPSVAASSAAPEQAGDNTDDGDEDSDNDVGNNADGMEAYARGSVQLKHILGYLRAMGSNWFLFGVLLPLYILSQAATIAQSWWMAIWVGSAPSSSSSPSVTTIGPSVTPVSHLVGAGIAPGSAAFYALIYGGINVALALLTLLRGLTLTFGALTAASHLHDTALTGVAHAPASFFSANPAGRILNRFLSDQGTIDDTVRLTISQMAMLIFGFVGSIAVIAYFAPYTLLILLGLSWVYWIIAKGYRFAARDLRRMQSVGKSPIFQHFSEAIRGLSTIRAFGPAAARFFVQQHLEKSRRYGRAFLALWSSNEYISTWAEGIGCFVVLTGAMLGVWAHQQGKMSTADVGLLLSFLLQLPSLLMWTIRYSTQIEIDAVSIERLVQYASLQNEEKACLLPTTATVTAASSPPASAMGISFQEVKLSYLPHEEDTGDQERKGKATKKEKGKEKQDVVVPTSRPSVPVILKGFNLDLPAGKKLAIVGKTGHGKSTSLQAILRLYPFQEGRLLLNGVDLSAVSVREGRSMVTALLQDGFLFSGSVRENLLGPLMVPPPSSAIDAKKSSSSANKIRKGKKIAKASINNTDGDDDDDDNDGSEDVAAVPISINIAAATGDVYLPLADGPSNTSPASNTVVVTDSDLWKVLEQVSMKDAIAALPEGLDAPVAEGGSNFSAGEKALLCLARALVHRQMHKTSIAIADEPTASVDLMADRVVHETLLSLPDTLVCICHRLTYIPLFDLVAVVADGRVAEFGPPSVLMANPASRLRLLQDAAEASGSVFKAASTVAGAGAGGASTAAAAPSR